MRREVSTRCACACASASSSRATKSTMVEVPKRKLGKGERLRRRPWTTKAVRCRRRPRQEVSLSVKHTHSLTSGRKQIFGITYIYTL